ncbi:PLP-dependent aminotransferase family protein [Thalassotalea sp. HSM 43]|uniref:aminotransferase-like domain-containing protein n=1 Tax=Thalassotalea sp. HSM 43 TaxID=2552945 RepID=UPI001080C702|nr:PLP-dependent aminotransferase family protein [Thalassotalea sp. HSM 43]QBY05937.1 PLP-dependent aminotransferase family protein [Thalassotalea sp. HSM 43]
MATLYQQLSRKLTEQIQSGLIQPGEKLPSIRALMAEHQLAKNTVISALNDLEATGVIEAKPKIGYFVKPPEHANNNVPKQHFPELSRQSISLSDVFHKVMAKEAAFDILPTDKHHTPSNAILSLNKHIRRAFREDLHYRTSHYDTPKGNQTLREQISLRYRLRGVSINADDLCITAGCQHGLMLALMAVCQADDTIIVESPAFYGVLQLLAQLKLNVIEVSTNPVTGLDIDQLQQALQTWPVKACVVTPNFATPTGSLMPNHHRQALIDLANKHDIAVIEDDIYGELAFNDSVSALKTLDSQQRVILSSSVSKSLSRDIRVGWIVAGRWQKQVEQLKLSSLLACSSSIQAGVAAFMQSGDYRKHINIMCLQLAQQKRQLLSLLEQYWPHESRYTNPDGGICLWVELPQSFNTQALYQQLLADDIVITPGMLFSHKNDYQQCLRLSFQHAFDDKRKVVIKHIGEHINKHLV